MIWTEMFDNNYSTFNSTVSSRLHKEIEPEENNFEGENYCNEFDKTVSSIFIGD